MIKFTVYGNPVPQGRPRGTIRNGRIKMYDPQKSHDYKDYVRLAASQHAPRKLLEGALGLRVIIYRPIPKSFGKSKTEQSESGELRPTTKPDADNYVKAIKDALNKIIWKDDSQVVDLHVHKWYSDKPRVEVICWEIDEL